MGMLENKATIEENSDPIRWQIFGEQIEAPTKELTAYTKHDI